ncbi:hypothetical protein TNCV_1935301 [Trichonephila clavipes]|nr:hypothetical protein TNCV_1935301 [Trichonephila clavipes]
MGEIISDEKDHQVNGPILRLCHVYSDGPLLLMLVKPHEMYLLVSFENALRTRYMWASNYRCSQERDLLEKAVYWKNPLQHFNNLKKQPVTNVLPFHRRDYKKCMLILASDSDVIMADSGHLENV